MHWIRLKNALKHSLKGLFRGGANELPTKMQNKENTTFLSSSVAGGGGGYSPPPPIDMSTKMQNGKNTTFLALQDCFMHWSGLNSDLKHLLKHIFRGGG